MRGSPGRRPEPPRPGWTRILAGSGRQGEGPGSVVRLGRLARGARACPGWPAAPGHSGARLAPAEAERMPGGIRVDLVPLGRLDVSCPLEQLGSQRDDLIVGC